MTRSYQLLSIIALYSDIANTFHVHQGYGAVYCWKRLASGHARFIAAHGG